MNKRLTTALLLPLLCGCSSPKLETSDAIRVCIHAPDPSARFTYPQDAVAQEKLAAWLHQHEKQRCRYTLTQYAPHITVNFPNRVTVFFYTDSVHVSPVSMRQYIRDATPADAAFCDYLKSIAPQARSELKPPTP